LPHDALDHTFEPLRVVQFPLVEPEAPSFRYRNRWNGSTDT
jgi:hypothetical protein